jgi:hypothetical protein
MKLLDLASEIQEPILFLPLSQALNERNLRPLAGRIDWAEQRRVFQKTTGRVFTTSALCVPCPRGCQPARPAAGGDICITFVERPRHLLASHSRVSSEMEGISCQNTEIH